MASGLSLWPWRVSSLFSEFGSDYVLLGDSEDPGVKQ